MGSSTVIVQSATTLGRALRDRRRARRLTQAQVAARAGIAQPTLSNIERGASQVSLQTLLSLLAALELELVVQPRRVEDVARAWERS